jgi:protein-tyrosine kinase
MVIERALEKLKQAKAANVAGAAKVDRSPGSRTADTYVADHRNMRAPAADLRPPADVPISPRPTFPKLVCDGDAATRNRILLPGTPLAADGRVGAAYRMIRARLQNLISTNEWTTLALTSPDAGEGKSVTALNLALSFSRDESRRIFLIDLDMRNPTICKYLGVRPPQSLVDYLTGTCPPQDVFFSIGNDNLAIAGNSETTDQASELLAGNRIDQLFDYIKSIAPNALIIIDQPPLLVTDEALMMAPRVDATALVVADGQTRRDSLQRARQLLADYSFAGVILNKSSESVGKAGYYYGYGPRDK